MVTPFLQNHIYVIGVAELKIKLSSNVIESEINPAYDVTTKNQIR